MPRVLIPWIPSGLVRTGLRVPSWRLSLGDHQGGAGECWDSCVCFFLFVCPFVWEERGRVKERGRERGGGTNSRGYMYHFTLREDPANQFIRLGGYCSSPAPSCSTSFDSFSSTSCSSSSSSTYSSTSFSSSTPPLFLLLSSPPTVHPPHHSFSSYSYIPSFPSVNVLLSFVFYSYFPISSSLASKPAPSLPVLSGSCSYLATLSHTHARTCVHTKLNLVQNVSFFPTRRPPPSTLLPHLPPSPSFIILYFSHHLLLHPCPPPSLLHGLFFSTVHFHPSIHLFYPLPSCLSFYFTSLSYPTPYAFSDSSSTSISTSYFPSHSSLQQQNYIFLMWCFATTAN